MLFALPAGTPSALAVPSASFAWGDCAVGVVPAHAVGRVRCGVLTVPESRAAGSTSQRVVRLPVAVIASRSATPQPDPLVFPTTGGPGGGSLSALPTLVDWMDWAAADRQIIVVEQRGDAASDPTLNCPEFDTAQQITDGRLKPDPDPTAWQRCRDRLVAAGVDLSAYTSTNSAADLADLRRTMGFDQWNLYGISYGTRLALTTMRDYPAGLRSVVLDGVYPPHVNLAEQLPAGFRASVGHLLASCAADARCRAAYPDLEQKLIGLLERTAQTPIEVTIHGPDGNDLVLTLRDQDIANGLFQALYDSALVRILPWVIDQLANGNTAAALPLAQQQVDFRDWFTEGLQQSIECAEEVPFDDPERIRTARVSSPLTAHLPPLDQIKQECEVWGVRALGAVENQLVRSDIPTLLTSGGYDPITPPAWARSAVPGLSRSYSFEFPTAGHGAVWQNWFDPCPAEIAGRFLRDPTRAPDATCIAATPPTAFLTPDEIVPTPAVYLLDRDVIRPLNPWHLGLVGMAAVVFLITLILGSWTLIRRRADLPRETVVAVVLSALHLAFIGGLYWMVTCTDPLILGFGMPPAGRALGWVAILAAVVTVALAWLLARRWFRRGLRGRWSWLTVTAVASMAFLGWLVARGLIVL